MKPTLDYPGEYNAWNQMKQRCNNKNHSDYKNYGARGISICERWLLFKNFINDMGNRPDGYSLDRKNNDGHYEPDNCRWANRYTQTQNRRNMHFIEFNGFSFTLNGWAKHLGITSAAIHKRKKLNLPIEELLSPRNEKFKNTVFLKKASP